MKGDKQPHQSLLYNPPADAPSFDTTGQICPPGATPRVTATLWEDEGALCFQVDANGVCVARREDNHMINGTKLLNVTDMARGRRDGILKSEKTRHVVKIGPIHLKGVWIPFDRALEIANLEKITEMLYPLFVYNIGALLYHPANQARHTIEDVAIGTHRTGEHTQLDQLHGSARSDAPSLEYIQSQEIEMGGFVDHTPALDLECTGDEDMGEDRDDSLCPVMPAMSLDEAQEQGWVIVPFPEIEEDEELGKLT